MILMGCHMVAKTFCFRIDSFKVQNKIEMFQFCLNLFMRSNDAYLHYLLVQSTECQLLR